MRLSLPTVPPGRFGPPGVRPAARPVGRSGGTVRRPDEEAALPHLPRRPGADAGPLAVDGHGDLHARVGHRHHLRAGQRGERRVRPRPSARLHHRRADAGHEVPLPGHDGRRRVPGVLQHGAERLGDEAEVPGLRRHAHLPCDPQPGRGRHALRPRGRLEPPVPGPLHGRLRNDRDQRDPPGPPSSSTRPWRMSGS